jgi:RHH-type transcriptional regulator, proline utilization regulon repressor / proline dehydrogenase / delta 1-pyrroline-5-carboxylate dehydrogenase
VVAPERSDDQVAVARAEQLAAELLERAKAYDDRGERRRRRRVSRLLDDPAGKTFVLELTDEIVRIRDPARAARRLDDLVSARGVPRFAGPLDRLALRLAGPLANRFPRAVMPAVIARLRREFAGVVLPVEERAFAAHAARRRRVGIRLNVNVLGEAILGDGEAARRLDTIVGQLRRSDVDYVSVKISAICAQLDVLPFAESVARVAVPLRVLYDEALRHDPPKFVNLDMEEFRDLELTTSAFRSVLDEPAYRRLDAGLVLQAYLPDSYAAATELADWALARHRGGGGRIKIRLVKGANLAMERVEAELHGWPLAPYGDKSAVDANYKGMLDALLDARYAGAVRIGAASHNLFDVAWALVQRDAKDASDRVEIEMLEGMANPQARAVRDVSGGLLLYAPVARRDDFESAIAYLVRRLDENTGADNFLRALFSLEPGSVAWEDQRDRFRLAVKERHTVSHRPNRDQDRGSEQRRHTGAFVNEPDTDFALAANRHWIAKALADWRAAPLTEVGAVVDGGDVTGPLTEVGVDPSHPDEPAYRYTVADVDMVERAVAAAAGAHEQWRAREGDERRSVLARVADVMAAQRGRTLAAMAYDAGKTVREGDPEVSEAIDFARHYGDCARRLGRSANDGPTFTPYGTVLVASPWNFPYAIPAGGVCAALAAGNAVILKPAPETVLTARMLAEQCWEAGVPRDLLQFLPCRDDDVGRHLVTHDGIGAVVLTGAFETARMFLEWKPAMRLHAETSGKNAIVITAAADIDLAVRDLVRSAFGHAGQKCSAASLAIVEASVYDDPTFLPRLADATRTLTVGASTDLTTVMGPLIRPPAGPLAEALVRLDDGESWLVAPRRLDETGYSWSPGVKIGVRRGAPFHLTECFGPVLGVMRAADLDEAIAAQNEPPFGLTAGLFSLDEQEIARWCAAVRAGNLYVNRHITGAIVQRQPFGGWKRSVVGPGAKAGGPNYVASLGTWRTFEPHDSARFAATATPVWDAEFRRDRDPAGLRAERNRFGYRPYGRGVVLRVSADVDPAVIESCRTAARLAGTPIEVSSAIAEDDDAFRRRLHGFAVDKVRVLGYPYGTFALDVIASGAAHDDVAFVADPRVELHRWVREQAVSETRHRHGNLLE